MDSEKYMQESGRTNIDYPEGLEIEGEDVAVLKNLIGEVILCGNAIDVYKKFLAYGKALPEGTRDEHIQSTVEKMKLTRNQWHLLHAAMGKVTEAAEFMESIFKHIFLKENLHLTNILEEVGDGWWYDMIVCRLYHVKPGSIMKANIDKLMTRYPDGFNATDAVKRDLEAEQCAITGMVQEDLFKVSGVPYRVSKEDIKHD